MVINERVRVALLKNGVPQWKLANVLGVSQSTLTRMFRTELPEEEQERIVALIEKDVSKHD